jgi:hypothetical protein
MYLDDIAGLISAQLPEDALPDEPHTQRLLRLYAVLVRAKGTAVTDEDVHDAWAAWMADTDPDHDALVPYSELEAETRAEDEPFVDAIRSVAEQLASG